MKLHPGGWLYALALSLLAGCAVETTSRREAPAMTPAESRALVGSLLPKGVDDRAGWAADIHAAMAALQVPARPDNICAVVAITEQETGFHVDPVIPNLSAIAWKEIERQRERAGVPKLALYAALKLPSSDGRSYEARIEAAETEWQLSEVYEDLIGRVPMARSFLEDRNPVRTGGPMQVSVAFAKIHAEKRHYPYPVTESLRHEVFTRRGGMYFGIAHLFDYPVSYDRILYRFADYNAGHYASRNAAFQKAVAEASGIVIDLDGDLVRFDHGKPAKEPGLTERAVRSLAKRIDMSDEAIRHDLEMGDTIALEKTKLYTRVYEIADRAGGKAAPRAVLPQIVLQSSKTTRKLTTDWFARRVAERQKACLARAVDPVKGRS